MKVLAVEMSTPRASLALYEPDSSPRCIHWAEPRSGGQLLFRHLREQMAAAGWTFDRLDLLAAGRGPGNYSGLRSALTVVQALALPADQPVFAVSSGKILATALAREFPDVSRFAIAGDARRRHLWLGLFERDASVLSMITDWQLLAPGDFAARVPADTLIASPEFERLKEGGLLAPDVFETFQWIPENRFPDAGTLAALACARQGRDSEPVTPVYMHPPVATPPRS